MKFSFGYDFSFSKRRANVLLATENFDFNNFETSCLPNGELIEDGSCEGIFKEMIKSKHIEVFKDKGGE
jgi:hypothetical protein